MALRMRGRPWERIGFAALVSTALLWMLSVRSSALRDIDGLAGDYLRSWRSNDRRVELADSVSWSDFAYCTYATQTDHLCNSLMLMESLHRLQVKADLLLLYASFWDATNTSIPEGRLLTKARVEYGANVRPISILRAKNVSDPTWAAGFTKWLAYNQTQYKRIMTLDSDGTILRPMDELFLMPSSPVALPRAYWLNGSLSAQITLVQPSDSAFAAVQKQIAERDKDDYDMEIINALYGDSCAIIPHRPYNLLTGEFRKTEHAAYLGSTTETWDAENTIQEAKYVHFSDWPLPKPWQSHSEMLELERMPGCAGAEDCAERRVWKWLYEDFRERRQSVCGADFNTWEPAETSMEVQRLLGAPNPAQKADSK